MLWKPSPKLVLGGCLVASFASNALFNVQKTPYPADLIGNVDEKLSAFLIYSAYIGNGIFKTTSPTTCAVLSQYKYAQQHGYEYHFYSDPTPDWVKEKKKYKLSNGWYKIFALRLLLASRRHNHNDGWVVYLDADSVIKNPNVTLEQIVGQAPNNETSLIMRNRPGWDAFIILLRNTEFSRRMVELIWSLRATYNNCVSEQCAVNYGLLDGILQQEATATPQTFTVATDQERPCCDPLVQHEANDISMQGCLWNWMDTLQVRQKNSHPHIFWSFEYYDLNIHHEWGGEHSTKKKCKRKRQFPTVSRLPEWILEPEVYEPAFRVGINPNNTTTCTLTPA